MLLDKLFFPSINSRKIKSPILVVGNPRSGTTFLHRYLVNHSFGSGTKYIKCFIPYFASENNKTIFTNA